MGFYFVHADLPRSLRAPISLLLAPVAIIDGLCYGLGVPGIYGKPIPMFMVNLGSGMVICLDGLAVASMASTSKPNVNRPRLTTRCTGAAASVGF